MSRAPAVSVVIPSFERRELLPRAIESVLAQTRPAAETIVVDDGSTDGTSDVVASRFPQVRLLRQENRGVSAARNAGISAASGDWIALLDSDDEWLPQKLERQLEALGRHPGYRFCHTDEIWLRNGRRVNPGSKHAKAGEWIFERCLPRCAISPSAAVIDRAVFEEIGYFDEELEACEDYDYWLRFCARFPVLFVDEPLLVKHGGHDDQLSQTVWGQDRFRIRALDKLLRRVPLRPADRLAAIRTLAAKIEVFAAGARKRGRHREVELLLELGRRYERELVAAGDEVGA